MKRIEIYVIAIFMAIASISTNINAQEMGEFTDSRDGTSYKTVKIGTQTWMAENLAFKSKNGCWAYNDNTAKIEKYGYLYNWETALSSCPSGWKLPSDDEWDELVSFLGGSVDACNKLKSTKTWMENYGTNQSGFNAVAGGKRTNNGSYKEAGEGSNLWSATANGSNQVWGRYMFYFVNEIMRKGIYTKGDACSVRCIKN